MPVLERILIYPIKSLDGVWRASAQLASGGALRHDREFALIDAQNRFVNGKCFPKIHRLRATFDLDAFTATLSSAPGDAARFHLLDDKARLEEYFSDYFGFRVFLARNATQGFPDDQDASGATVVTLATMRQIAQWFPHLDAEELIRRFRVNLILGEAEAFWEDRLFGADGESVRFQVGEARFEGIKPCARCVVPTRDSRTGESEARFQKMFSDKRRDALPIWAEPSRFDHFYRLSVNTYAPDSEIGKTVRLGDAVKILA